MSALIQLKAGATPAYSLRALARLLSYPDAALRDTVPDLQQVLINEAAVDDSRLRGLSMLLGSLVGRSGPSSLRKV